MGGREEGNRLKEQKTTKGSIKQLMYPQESHDYIRTNGSLPRLAQN